MRKSWQGFTLVELLVVMAVIALLAGFILPSFGKAREQGRKTQCMNNLKQIGLGIEMYRVDNEDRYPADLNVLYNTATPSDGYIDNLKVFKCPSTVNAVPATPGAGDYTYVGAALAPNAPSGSLVAHDDANNHAGGRNELFADGHVEWN